MNVTVASGITQVAAGAVLGFPLAAETAAPGTLRTHGIRDARRIKQLHLDLIMMGGLVATAGMVAPNASGWIRHPLAIGGWTNALAFAPLAIRPQLTGHRTFQTLTALSFATTSIAWIGLAASSWHRLARTKAR